MMAVMASEDIRKGWQRTESKVVRPFRSADDYLRDVALRLYVDGEFSATDNVQLEKVERDRLSVALRLAAPPDAFSDVVGAGLDELELIISIDDLALKQATVLRSFPLEEVVDSVVELGEEAKELASWLGETHIHVAVVLSRGREAIVGLAHRVGSWVARKTFKIAPARDTSTFDIRAVDEDWFVKRELPANTAYYVEILDADLNQPCDQFPQLVQVYMNKNLYATLARAGDHPLARALVKAIYVDVTSSILSVGYANLEGEALSTSILGVVSGRLSRATGIAERRLIDYAKDNNGTRLRALVQSQADLTKEIISAMARRGS